MDLKDIFALIGGLAMFIYGMQQMGDALQKTAGDKMRTFLAMMTGTPLRGILFGMLVTTILQSSSATSVLVIGFTGAGLMTLNQAIGVIMGAKIGTTMTAWIVAAKIDQYAWVFVALGFFVMFFLKKPKVRYIGQLIFSFGALFVGLNTMSNAMKPLTQSQAFVDLLLRVKDYPILGFFGGTAITMLIQSSSVAIGVLQTLASTPLDAAGTPLVSLYQAIPIMLGSNVGTTITAIMAAIGAPRISKRTAAAQSLISMVGAVVFMLILGPYTAVIGRFLSWIGQTVIPDLLVGPYALVTPIASHMRESIAISHTVFNIVNTALWLPFTWVIVKLVHLIVPGEDPVIEKKLVYIDYNVVKSPAIAIDLAAQELARMTEIASQMTKDSHHLITIKGLNEEMEKRVFTNEDTLDYLENEIVKYLSNIISATTMTPVNSSRIAALMHAANDIERIGDYCSNITDNSIQMKEAGLVFSKAAIDDLDHAFEIIEEMVANSIEALRTSNREVARTIIEQEIYVDDLEIKLRESHMQRLDEGTCNPQSTVIFFELLHTIERISDHCRNIAEAVSRGQHYLVHNQASPTRPVLPES